jgi:hypothetical protein
MEDEVMDAAEELADQPTAEESGDEEQPSGEPFLKVNDRTVFKDRDSALKGFEEREKLIGHYRQLGDPQELQARLERLRLLEQVMGGKPDEDTPKTAWTKEQIEANRAYLRELQKLGMFKELGLLSREEWQAELAQQQEAYREHLAETANDEGRKWLETHGLTNLSDEEIEEALTLGGHMVSTNERLNRMYFVEGKVPEVVDYCLSRIFRAEIKSKQNASTEANKQVAGQVRERAAQVERGADKIKKLPPPPPKSGSAGASAPKPPDLKDARIRRQKVEEILEREGALA